MKRGVMKRYLLSLLCIAGMLLITCGNEPPEDFYKGTPEDSTAIAQLLNANPGLLVTEDMFDSTYVPITTGPIVFSQADSFMRDDPTMIKQEVDSCGLKLSVRDDTLDFWFAKDTTCTVYIRDAFTVFSLVHAVEKQTAYYDSAEVSPTGDTTWRIGTTVTDTTDYYAQDTIAGIGFRTIFFDPIRELVEDPETGDSVWAVRDPIEWQLVRISYGIYNFPTLVGDSPDIDTVLLERTTGDIDTILASNYDTTYAGHVMDRFRSPDSLLTYRDGETLFVSIILHALSVGQDTCLYFASCAGSNRVELATDSVFIVNGTSGSIANLYFEAVFTDLSYFYVLPDKDYTAQVWLLPVRIE